MSAIKLSIHAAAQEWGIHRETLGKALKKASIEPDGDGHFTITQIDRAIHGDAEAERARKTREEADKIAMDNASTRGELLDLEDFSKRMESKAAGVRRVIEEMGIPEDKADQILNAFAELFAVR